MFLSSLRRNQRWFLIIFAAGLLSTLILQQNTSTNAQRAIVPTNTPDPRGHSGVPTVPANAPEVSVTGYLSAHHGHSNNGDVHTVVFVVDEQGNSTDLSMDFFAAQKLNGKKVTVKGKQIHKKTKTTESDLVQVTAVQALGGTSSDTALASPVSGSRPWVNVLCRFADETGNTPKSPSYFDILVSNTYPGINHYWREMSYNIANIDGTVTRGWYNLPHTRSYYFRSDGSFNLTLAAQECAPLAQSSVYFPSYTGINFMFNDNLDCCAWGGGGTYLVLNGVGKYYSTTWMPPWGFNNQRILAHEMGHGFGLPHSAASSSYPGFPYNNWWDVMSKGGDDCTIRDATLGCQGTGTIGYHRDMLAWIAADRRFVANVGTVNVTITLERIDLPVSTTNYLIAVIPINNSSTHFYTVEARKKVGYDAALRGEAVIIHEVDTSRNEDAHVVDTNSDGNSSTGDGSAMWTVGETFTDSANNIRVAVVGQPSSSSYSITISNGTIAVPTNTPVPTPVGTTNIALNKASTGSSTCAAGEEPSQAVDGSSATKWCGFLSGGSVSMMVDLGVSYNVSYFVVKHAGAGGEASSLNTKDFQIQTSIDGTTWSTVASVIGNTANVTTHAISAVNAHYARLWITAPEGTVMSNAARIYEFEVYGVMVATGDGNPYSGTPIALPGTVQAENYNVGGQGVAYNDSDTTNNGNANGNTFRTAEGVDTEATADTGAGYNVGWTAAGEWLKYTVNIQTAATYTVKFRVASAQTGGTFHLEVDGVNMTGILVVPNTGGWQIWTDVNKSGINLTAGQHVLRLVMDSAGGNFNWFSAINDGTPYGGTPVSLPGTVQAENYNVGGQGVAYSDIEAANQGNIYRIAEGVDIEATTDTGGGYNLGWTRVGEWVKYSVNVTTSGVYIMNFRVANGITTGNFYVEVDGVDVTGTIAVPNTGGWQTWATISKTGINLSAGQHIIRFVFTGDDSNINWFSITP